MGTSCQDKHVQIETELGEVQPNLMCSSAITNTVEIIYNPWCNLFQIMSTVGNTSMHSRSAELPISSKRHFMSTKAVQVLR